MKYLILLTIFFILGCDKQRAIVLDAPAPTWVNKMESFCVTANSEVEDRTITALTNPGLRSNSYHLQYRVVCKNKATVKLTYAFGNSDSIILTIEDDKRVNDLYNEKDFE